MSADVKSQFLKDTSALLYFSHKMIFSDAELIHIELDVALSNILVLFVWKLFESVLASEAMVTHLASP